MLVSSHQSHIILGRRMIKKELPSCNPKLYREGENVECMIRKEFRTMTPEQKAVTSKMLKYNVHGNGFLQIVTGVDSRLHIWHDSIPKQVIPSVYHDHRFDFESIILYGELINIKLDVLPGGDYLMYRPESQNIPNVDGKLERLGKADYTPQIRQLDAHTKKTKYFMRAGIFHHTVPIGTTVTHMTILDKYENHIPRVLCHKNLEPDNSFSRIDAMSIDDVWALLKELNLTRFV